MCQLNEIEKMIQTMEEIIIIITYSQSSRNPWCKPIIPQQYQTRCQFPLGVMGIQKLW